MQYFTRVFIAIVALFFGSCQPKNTLQNYMANSWQTTYLKIEMPTYQQSDSLQVFEDDFDDDTELIAQSKYHKDGTFLAWFLNKKGEKVSPSEGTWKIIGDSLYVAFFYNHRNMEVSYHITKTKEGFLAKSKYDWDNDGKLDDLLTMKTKQLP